MGSTSLSLSTPLGADEIEGPEEVSAPGITWARHKGGNIKNKKTNKPNNNNKTCDRRKGSNNTSFLSADFGEEEERP